MISPAKHFKIIYEESILIAIPEIPIRILANSIAEMWNWTIIIFDLNFNSIDFNIYWWYIVLRVVRTIELIN